VVPVLHIENLSVDFRMEQETVSAIRNINLTIHRGELLALVGESGSGKSVTSLSILQLLPSPPAIYTSGNIYFHDSNKQIDLLGAEPGELRSVRGSKIAMIFQEPMSSLNPVMTCGRQVAEAIRLHKKLSKAAARKLVLEWFRKVKLPDPEKMYDRYPHQISGGQKQRVMIAMAMCCEPALLICDEPTTALDVTVQKTILELIKELQQDRNMAVLFITHDLGVVAEIADRVAIMYKGDIVEENSRQQIFTYPQHPYTKALIACRPGLHSRDERLPTISDFLDQATTHNVQLKSAPTNEVLVDVKHLTVSFPVRSNLFGKATAYMNAVDDVSFQLFKGETLGLVGESGCGKTTLGRTLLRLIDPTSGQIIYAGKDITAYTKKELTAFRKDVQLIFQDPFSSLNPRITVGDALQEPVKLFRPDLDRKKLIADLLDKVNLPASAARRYPHEFSGGQRQRIVIARALTLNPDFLVCDESVSALDVSVQAQVLNLLNDLKAELGLTLLFISHDLSVVRYMSDRMIVMNKGSIVEEGLAEDIYRHPRSAYTQNLIASIPKIVA
jgi:peptide/nickel transport system ATP-binding protein